MNVLLVSQCNKRALTQTRRLLDQFAERKGERTWQTSITQAGLDTLRKLLRQTARKNTAVACHRIGGKDHSELLWIVGDARQFNEEGTVPTNSTERDILRRHDENTWHSLAHIQQLAALAALLHDIGKASDAFQSRLKGELKDKNIYRHEWISVRLFQAFVTSCGLQDDRVWLTQLATCANLPEFSPAPAQTGTNKRASTKTHSKTPAQPQSPQLMQWLERWLGAHLLRDGLQPSIKEEQNPLQQLPPLARAIAWLILSHHRLPAVPKPPSDADDKQFKAWHGQKFTSMQVGNIAHTLRKIDANWNEPYSAPARKTQTAQTLKPYWSFDNGLPIATAAWRKRAARTAQRLLTSALPQAAALGLQKPPALSTAEENTEVKPKAASEAKTETQTEATSATTAHTLIDNPYAMHMARLALMLGDHYYSSLSDQKLRVAGSAQCRTYANTERRASPSTQGQAPLLQQLDEHLLGVELHTSQIVHALPSFTQQLAHLKNHKLLKKRSEKEAFRWQDKAADLAASVRQNAAEHGAFIVNMASTGCGKTLGNARIMNALANPALGMRCAFAIGLRTLTLQTGRSFQQDLHLGEDELAIQVGGSASRELFEYYEKEAEKNGSASRQELLDETTHVVFEGNDQHPVLQHLGHDSAAKKLLAAPLLVCTVDHLTPATESLRGGKQIAPMLRLLSGDLVLDEPDDFDIADLPALTRLVHWAGLLGSRVLLSSATLPPALVEGLFMAYWAGRRSYQSNRGERPHESPRPVCLWVDEFNRSHAQCADAASFAQAHKEFAQTRVAQLQKQTLQQVRRQAQLLPLPTNFAGMRKEQRRSEFARELLDAALALHRTHHSQDTGGIAVDSSNKASAKRISFGLIRMANIGPLFEVARALLALTVPSGVRIHLCVYHSQFPLFVRSAIEQRLDAALNRRDENAVFFLPDIRRAIDAHAEADQLFIVLGSPVTEVGRDHDYDWAVVEPSSMRSLIQLAGRVLRHRHHKAVHAPNMLVCNTNLKHFESHDGIAYTRPGFESKTYKLNTHSLTDLLSPWLNAQQQMPIDARPRILPRNVTPLSPQTNWVDLEHCRMQAQMLPCVHSPQTTATAIPHAAATTATAAAAPAAKGNRMRSRPLAAQAAQTAPTAEKPITANESNTGNATTALPALPTLSTYNASLNASTFWGFPSIHLTGAMQQAQPFRQEDTQDDVEIALLPNEDEDGYTLYRLAEGEKKWQMLYIEWNARLSRIADDEVSNPQIAPWAQVDFIEAMQSQAQAMDLPLARFAKKFSTLRLPLKTNNNQGWYWHPWLGFCQR